MTEEAKDNGRPLVLRVTFDVNGKQIMQFTAVNVSEKFGLKYGSGPQVYRDGLGRYLRHNFEDGARALAVKMINIEEKSEKEPS